MKEYEVEITDKAAQDLRKSVGYLYNVKKSPIAAAHVLDDFNETIKAVSYLADSIVIPQNEKLKQRGLKRINFRYHRYFLLFKITEDKVYITNMFHALENYENKLD